MKTVQERIWNVTERRVTNIKLASTIPIATDETRDISDNAQETLFAMQGPKAELLGLLSPKVQTSGEGSYRNIFENII